MIITSIYSSSLVSHLTYPQFEPMIDTPEEYVKAGLYWGTPYEPPLSHIFDLDVSLKMMNIRYRLQIRTPKKSKLK